MTAWLLALIMAAATGLPAQVAGPSAPGEGGFTISQEQLDRLLAPIALYPDVLLSQILMTSTYPLEVVEADRWLTQHPELSGDDLDSALREKPWDVSVKSLCRFPRVLGMMSQELGSTTALGDAYLNQRDQVMDTIQKLRARAREEGNLNAPREETVVVQDGYVSIVPLEPEIVYVPVYDPCTIYGPWWYPECTPLWFWWSDIVAGIGFWWGPPVFIGRLHDWCGFNWRQHTIVVHPRRAAYLGGIGLTRMHGGAETWHHNPIHRRGLAYSNPETARRFGQVPRPGIEARRLYRGFPPPEAGTGGWQRVAPQPAPAPAQSGRPEARGPAGPPAFREFHPPVSGPGLPPQSGPRAIPSPARPVWPEAGGHERSPGFGEFHSPEGGPRPQAHPGPRPLTAPTFRPEVHQPGTATPFEGFGRSGPEVQQHSERGFQSMGGEGHGGGHPGGFPQGGAHPGGRR
jgi:hypothetical protein